MSVQEAIVAFAVFGGGFWMLHPLVVALSKRISGEVRGVPKADDLAALRADVLDEMQRVRQEVSELAERVDFAERLLAKNRDADRLAPPGAR